MTISQMRLCRSWNIGEKVGELHGEQQRVVRKVFCGVVVSEGIFIEFRALMADI